MDPSVRAASDKAAYHLWELEIALDPANPGHISPPVVEAGKRVLDVGCGAGQTLQAAYSDRPAVGIDLDFEAIRLGRSLGWCATLACGHAEALPFADDSFDVVIARSSLQYTDLARSLPEIRRVLRSGGLVWMVLHSFSVVWNVAKGFRLKSWLLFTYIVLNSLMFNITGRQVGLPGPRYESFQTARGMRRTLRRLGFADICIQPYVTYWEAGCDGGSSTPRKPFRHLIVTARAE